MKLLLLSLCTVLETTTVSLDLNLAVLDLPLYFLVVVVLSSVDRGNRPTNTHKQTGVITIHCAAKLAHSVMMLQHSLIRVTRLEREHIIIIVVDCGRRRMPLCPHLLQLVLWPCLHVGNPTAKIEYFLSGT